jgi:hypothetical protein
MNPVYTFTKRVKDAIIKRKDVPDASDIVKLAEVVGRLEALPGVCLSHLDDIGLRTNPKKWIATCLSSYPSSVDFSRMEDLLHDFTDSMQTRMREEAKYALALLMENRLILCHSLFGEETVTPEWRIIPRMLDRDNVLRFASFTQEQGQIDIRYWERHATSSFVEWLGLPRKKAFLFGGRYAIRSELESVLVELQLTEPEMDQWLVRHPEIRDGRIDLASPIHQFRITEIRVGLKHYDNTADFLQDYEAEKQGLPRYQREYERLKAEALPLLVKYYDEKTRVIRKQGDEEVLEIDKAASDFDVVFADGTIEFRASYLSDLARRIVNGEQLRLFHVALPFRASPLAIGTLKIYNDMRVSAPAQRVIDFYNATGLQDYALHILVKYVAIRLLGIANLLSPVSYLLDELASQLASQVVLPSRLTKVEDDVLEFKSRDVMAGDNDGIGRALAEDIEAKLKGSDCAVLLIGVEDDGTLGLLPASRLRSDRVEVIRNRIVEHLSSIDVHLLPLIQGEDALLLLVALPR